jgi:hypothetical protein
MQHLLFACYILYIMDMPYTYRVAFIIYKFILFKSVLIRVQRLRFFRPWSVAVLVGFGISVSVFPKSSVNRSRVSVFKKSSKK